MIPGVLHSLLLIGAVGRLVWIGSWLEIGIAVAVLVSWIVTILVAQAQLEAALQHTERLMDTIVRLEERQAATWDDPPPRPRSWPRRSH